MDDFNIAPMLLEVFSNKSSMAMVGLVFTAKQAAPIEQALVDVFNVPGSHQLKKLVLVNRPVALRLFVLIANILASCDLWYMSLVNAADSLPEVL